MKSLWLATTADKFELPLCVEDSAEKLAAKLGVTKSAVYKFIEDGRRGKHTGRKIFKVSVGDDM